MVTINDDELYLTERDLWEYQGRPFTGRAREYSPDGALIGESEYVDGMLDGVLRVWYPSGQLHEEEHFRANSWHGVSREWYEDGKLKRETLLEHGICVQERRWDEGGNLISDYVLTEDNPKFTRLEQLRRIHARLQGVAKPAPESPP